MLLSEYKKATELELTDQEIEQAIFTQSQMETETSLLEKQIEQAILAESQKDYFEQLHKRYNL